MFLFATFASKMVFVGVGCFKEEPLTLTPDLINTPSSMDISSSKKVFTFPGILPDGEIKNKQISIQTAKGDIVFELFADTAPKTVSNFVYLTQQGFYQGLIFHRREEGFVIQGGDPNGNGTGGPGYTFEDELSDTYTYERGMVAMANRGPNTNGSQFFIMLAGTPLPKNYTIFGKVISGMDIVDKIQVGDEMISVQVQNQPSQLK
jgi:cyclophilin family peptidyl-prolyl cis-trans isomerase